MNERTIFLFDGVGAALSFVVTGLILPHFADLLGLSKPMIYGLAAFPAVYMVYSFCCYGLVKAIRSWMLLSLMAANFVYCLVSGGIIVFHDELRDLGRVLLAAEILIVMGVISLEWKVYRKLLAT